jgi:hypothetical protein
MHCGRFTVHDVLAQMQGYTSSSSSSSSSFFSSSSSSPSSGASPVPLTVAEKAALLSTHKGFSSVYWRCVNRITGKLERALDKKTDDKFAQVLRKELRLLVEFADVLKKRPASAATAQLLAAVVFAWWTVSDCRPALEAMREAAGTNGGGGGGGAGGGAADAVVDGGGGDVRDQHYLRQPHPAQLLSVFRLLGLNGACAEDYLDQNAVGDNSGPFAKMFQLDVVGLQAPLKLQSHMAEIKSGEGALPCAYVCVCVSACVRARIRACWRAFDNETECCCTSANSVSALPHAIPLQATLAVLSQPAPARACLRTACVRNGLDVLGGGWVTAGG